MRRVCYATYITAGLIFVSCGGSAQQPQVVLPPPTTGTVNESLRDELLRRARGEDAVRELFMLKQRTTGGVDSVDVVRLGEVDTTNTRWLEGTIARQGWPTKAQVGMDGVRAAMLLVQYANLDTAFQTRVLPLIQKSFASGDLPGGDVAMLVDRVAINHGRPQVYGTQAKLANGHWVPAPIADSATVDARRKQMGLPPLRVYFRILDSLYTAPQ